MKPESDSNRRPLPYHLGRRFAGACGSSAFCSLAAARMEARVEATDGNRSQQALTSSVGEVVDLQEVREAAQ